MSDTDKMKDLIGFVENTRTGRGSILPPKNTSVLSDSLRTELLNQWSDAGREKAKIITKLTESDGNELFLTGWNGNDTFVGYENEKGLGYIPASRVLVAELDSKWNSDTTLGEVRKNLDEMDKHRVRALVDGLKKNVTKRSQGRRVNEAKNFMKKFLSFSAVTNDSELPVQVEDKKVKKIKNTLAHTKGNSMVVVKGKFSESVSKFNKLVEGNDPEVGALKKELSKKKPVVKNPELLTNPLPDYESKRMF